METEALEMYPCQLSWFGISGKSLRTLGGWGGRWPTYPSIKDSVLTE